MSIGHMAFALARSGRSLPAAGGNHALETIELLRHFSRSPRRSSFFTLIYPDLPGFKSICPDAVQLEWQKIRALLNFSSHRRRPANRPD